MPKNPCYKTYLYFISNYHTFLDKLNQNLHVELLHIHPLLNQFHLYSLNY